MSRYEQQIKANQKYIPAIEQALRDTYFSSYDQDFLLTDEGILDIENNVFKRYNHSLLHVIPWLDRQIDLKGKRVLEIGCGTGSSTAALAHYVQDIQGYDIHAQAVCGAQKRMEIMGLHNVTLHTIDENALVERIKGDSDSKYDIILLFAVLEHQTVAERQDTLKTCWDVLAEDGIMAVIDTPNILHYFDLHTSRLPFLHMLPTRLYARYAHNSPRTAFADSFSDEAEKSDTQLDLDIARWGRGASYHDFELALGKEYKNYIVASGFEPEILDWFGCTIEEEMLRWYVEKQGFDIPFACTRCVLNLIFKKLSAENSAKSTTCASPPPLSIFDPSLEKQIKTMENQIREQEVLIDNIYHSTTWRTGNLLGKPYRTIMQFFKQTT